jgi:lipoprotein-releasing system ATP-binding protein
MMTKKTPALRLESVQRRFMQGESVIEVLKGVSLELYPGEIVALLGPSGAGKSTLLHIAGLLEPSTCGEVFIEDERCSKMKDKRRTTLRRQTIGFIYQFHHLLPEFTAVENIMLPMMIEGIPEEQARNHALNLLGTLGLAERQSHVPTKLSGGEQQRVAILRALANQPKILLADEPTGNLDEKTAYKVFSELLTIVRGRKMAALIATHNIELARKMDRVLYLKNGLIETL